MKGPSAQVEIAPRSPRLVKHSAPRRAAARVAPAALVTLTLGAGLLAACSVLMDKNRDQCSSDADCAAFDAEAVCDLQRKVCMPGTGTTNPPGTCTLAKPPEAPGITNSTDVFSFTVVLVDHDYGDGLDGQPPRADELGYDLDGLCSTDTTDRSCMPNLWAGGSVRDFAGGRDNGILRALLNAPAYVGSKPISSQAESDAIRTGAIPPVGVVRVRNYSGTPQDDSLEVEWFAPTQVVTADGAETPNWDGTDGWQVSFESVAEGGDGIDPEQWVSAFYTEDAYVANYRLVARFPVAIDSNQLGIPARLQDAMVTGLLLQDPSTKEWTLADAVVTGRHSVQTVLSWLAEAMPSFMAVLSFCRDDGSYPLVRRLFCSGTDTLMSGEVDADRLCDGFTIAQGFGALPATFAGVAPARSGERPCPPETDPAFDDCETEGGL